MQFDKQILLIYIYSFDICHAHLHLFDNLLKRTQVKGIYTFPAIFRAWLNQSALFFTSVCLGVCVRVCFCVGVCLRFASSPGILARRHVEYPQ